MSREKDTMISSEFGNLQHHNRAKKGVHMQILYIMPYKKHTDRERIVIGHYAVDVY